MFTSTKVLIVVALLVAMVMCAVPASCQLTNYLNQPYNNTGYTIRNDSNVWVGYRLQVTTQTTVTALGRAVQAGSMTGNHTVRLWRDSDQSIVASVVVTGSSPTDLLGYKYEMLGTPVTLATGNYRIVSEEFQGGDKWMDEQPLSDCKSWAYVIANTAKSDGLYPTSSGGKAGWGYGPATLYTGTGPQGQLLTGYVEGPTGAKLSGATVTAVTGTDAPLTATTNANGTYILQVQPGTYTVTASKASYASSTDNNVVVDASPVTRNFTLQYGSVFMGYVEDVDSNRLAGATVVATGTSGNLTTTTASDGTYVILAYPGVFSITASKVGFDPATVSGITLGSTPYTQNLTLPLGKLITGQVTISGTTIPMGGVRLKTLDNVYTATSDSAGNYSLRMSNGTYTVRAYKAGFLPKDSTFTVTESGPGPNYGLDPGYDFQADFGNTRNPNGPWSYGYYNSTVTPATFTLMTSNSDPYQDPNIYKLWFGRSIAGWSNACYHATFIQNASGSATPALNGRPVLQPWQVAATAGSWTNDPTAVAATRFTMPASGYYQTTYGFTSLGKGFNTPTAPTACVVVEDGTQTAVGNITNETTVLAHTGLAKNWQAGKVLEWKISPFPTWWVSVGFTVAPPANAAYIIGHVKSDKPGNPPLSEVTVTASSGEDRSYTTQTDADGLYVMAVEPPPAGYEYEVNVIVPGDCYGNTTDSSFVVDGVVAGSRVVHDFVLSYNRKWDFAAEFSTVSNPRREWSYGYVETSSGRANFGLYTEFSNKFGWTPFWGPGFWTTSDSKNVRSPWYGGIGKNTTGAVFTSIDPFATSTQIWYLAPGQMVTIAGASIPGDTTTNTRIATIRWTAPESMVIDLDATWKSFYVPGQLVASGQLFDSRPALYHNGAVLSAPRLNGFFGTAANGYTDSIGPTPKVRLKTILPVTAGDTLDFSFEDFHVHAYKVPFDVDVKLAKVEDVVQATSISAIKALEPGTKVLVTTPMQLGCASAPNNDNQNTFAYQFGTQLPEKSFFVQSDDRLQGLRCVVPEGGLPVLNPAHKVTFSGVVGTDYLGQKVVNVGSINSYVTSSAPNPLGKTIKSVTKSGTLVRVWGKITGLQANPNLLTWTDTGGVTWPYYDYEYMTINDGSSTQDIKIPLHVQYKWMTSYFTTIRGLAVGHYVGVTGIAWTTNGTDVAVYPRDDNDIRDYTYEEAIQ
jgi:hypothetical protein